MSNHKVEQELEVNIKSSENNDGLTAENISQWIGTEKKKLLDAVDNDKIGHLSEILGRMENMTCRLCRMPGHSSFNCWYEEELYRMRFHCPAAIPIHLKLKCWNVQYYAQEKKRIQVERLLANNGNIFDLEFQIQLLKNP